MGSEAVAAVDLPDDPVTDPDGYRRLLLGLLGDDDPALVAAGTADRLRDLVRGAGDRLRSGRHRTNGRRWNASVTWSTASSS